MSKVIGIIGSRRRNTLRDYDAVREKFLELYEDGDRIVSGGCPQGGDRFAEQLAIEFQVPIMIYYARWKKLGKAAGFIRNVDIANEADILIACVAEDRTGGTEDTIKKFLARQGITEKDLYTV
jgi:hypothetical protein